ncbi:MAG: type II secretion system F family protein [Acidobacteriota bacterium]|nr:type II secretion system F family protein [Blastocatellia bacterium]MDW8411682.1 type II secretion system F family protein [Acidobacteriota bacterium]
MRVFNPGKGKVCLADESNYKLKDDELIVFTESFRDLYEAGIPVNQILRMLRQGTSNRHLAEVLSKLTSSVENGQMLSEAMRAYPGVFSQEYCALIRAAEKSGKWTRRFDGREFHDGILDMIALYIKRRSSIRERVISGMTYPALVFLAVVITISAFAFYILPALKSVLLQLGAKEISFMTKALITLGELVERHWWVFLVASAALAAAVNNYLSSLQGKKFLARLQLRVSPLNRIFVNLTLGEILWLMGMLFSAGLTPQEVLGVAAESCSNQEVAEGLKKAREKLYDGISFCECLRTSHPLFDGKVYMVIASAQKNGKLGSTLQSYALQLFEKADQSIDRTVRLIEPVMMIAAGIIVGMIVISYYSGLSAAVGSLAGR